MYEFKPDNMSDAKLITDLRGISATMDTKCKAHEMKEKAYIERTQLAKDRILEARRKINLMHEKRSEKEALIERTDFKAKQIDRRIQQMEQKIQHTRQAMRIDPGSSAEVTAMQKSLKDAFLKQSELQTKIIRGMRRKDALEKHLQAVIDKETRYRDRMRTLVEQLKYSVSRQDEIKKNIRDKVENLKKMHAQILDLEPNLRDSHTRMRRSEVVVFELEDKINRKESEIRAIHKETIYKEEEAERTKTEYQVKKERKFKGSEAIVDLTQR